MSGDVYCCDKCGESIYTRCDCGLPADRSEEIQSLEQEIKKRDALIMEAIDCISYLNPFKDGKSAEWLSKAKEIIGG